MGDSENATASTSQVDHPLRSPQDLSTGSEKAWNEDESGSGEGGPSQKKLKRSRTKTGCYGCRGRRIKCDETRPECSHCKRIGLDCVWTVAKDAPVLLAQDKSEQKRSLTACSACRDARARCSHDRPLCVRCAKKGIPCEFPIPRKMFIPAPASSANASAHQPPVPGRAPIQAQLSLPPQRLDLMAAGDLVYAHLDAYFEYVNPVSWHGFLHRGVMYERLAAGSVPRMLLLGLCAVTSTFVSTSQAAAAQAEAWAREVKHDIMDSLDVPQLTTLSATLLVIQFDEAKSRRASVWTILGMAVRQAYALQLNVESTDPNMTWAEREGRRRLMWACYCLDKFVGGGILDVMNVSETSLKIQLPCQDSNFNDQIPCVTPTLSAATEAYFTGDTVTHGTLGLSAHYFLLIYVRARVLRFRRNLTVYHLAPWDSLSEFEVCLLAIQTWRGTLPPDLLFEPSNIHDYASRSQLSAFLSLHMWAIQSACDMAHIAMPGFVELPSPNSLANAPPGWITSTRETCAQKASELSDLFVTVLREVPNFVSGDIGVATCAYQSIRIQIEWVLLARADERPRRREAAVARIDATLKIVRQMNGLWECVDYMYNAVVELLWRHGYSDIPAVSDQFPDPPPSTARPSNRAKPDRWVPALPAVLRRPESNVRDDIEVPSASGAAGGETEWPEDLPENAEWNWLTHGVGVTEEQSFLSLYTYATFDV